MHTHLPRKTAALLCLLVAIGITLIFGANGLYASLAGLVMFILLRRMMRHHIGGTTGDTAGALVELVEAATIMTLATLAH